VNDLERRCFRMRIWAKSSSEGSTDSGEETAHLHFDVTLRSPNGSFQCRAEVSGRMTENEFLEGVKHGKFTLRVIRPCPWEFSTLLFNDYEGRTQPTS
jgi:hypothetical protein